MTVTGGSDGPQGVIAPAVGFIALALVVGTIGGFAGWVVVHDSAEDVQYYEGTQYPLADPVTHQPREAWRIDVGSAYLLGVVGGIALTVDEEESMLVALSLEDGGEVWSREVDGAYLVPVTRDRLLIGTSGEVMALSVTTGEEIWSVDGDANAVSDVSLAVIEDDELRLHDLSDGALQWAVDVEIDYSEDDFSVGPSVAMADEVVAVIDRDRLTVYDADSGRERWSVSSDADDVEATDAAVVTVGDEFDGDAAKAYDADDGAELWSTNRVVSAARVSPADIVVLTDRAVLLVNGHGDDVSADLEDVGLDASTAQWAAIGGADLGGELVITIGAGNETAVAMDDRLRPLHDGDTAFTTDGIYLIDAERPDGDPVGGARVDYLPNFDADAAWSLDVDGYPVPVDEGILVREGAELVMYR